VPAVPEPAWVAADTESGTFRALWLWFAICRGAATLLWGCFFLFMFLAISADNKIDEAFSLSMGCLLILSSALFLVDTVLLLILLHRCWALLEDTPGATSPGKAVGLLFVPIFNLFWVFVAVYGLARALNAHLSSCQVRKPHASEGLGLAVCIVWSVSLLGLVPGLAVPPILVLALLLSLANSVLWILFTYSLTQAAGAVAATRNDSVAQSA
jgi:hypothetical protein